MLFAPFTQNRLKASCTKRLQDRTERIVALRRYSSEMDERNASMKMSALLTISFGTLPRALGEARHHFDGDLRHTKKPSAEPANSPAIPHTIASSVKAWRTFRVPSK